MALYEMRLIWFGGVKYCLCFISQQDRKLFKKKGIFWIPDFQHRTLPEFFGAEELAHKEKNDLAMTGSDNPMVLSSFDAARDLDVSIRDTDARSR